MRLGGDSAHVTVPAACFSAFGSAVGHLVTYCPQITIQFIKGVHFQNATWILMQPQNLRRQQHPNPGRSFLCHLKVRLFGEFGFLLRLTVF